MFAHGATFDPHLFLTETTLEFDDVWQNNYGGDRSAGVSKSLGDGLTIRIFEQEKIAIEYLAANTNSLKALAKYPGVSTFILGLQYHIELDAGTLGFSMGPSALLMWHCLEIGIEPVFYVSLDHHEKSSASPA